MLSAKKDKELLLKLGLTEDDLKEFEEWMLYEKPNTELEKKTIEVVLEWLRQRHTERNEG